MDIKLKDFEGPLDCSWFLSMSEYFDVPIVEVDEQYLACWQPCKPWSLKLLGIYAYGFVKLMLIKSRKLLPILAEAGRSRWSELRALEVSWKNMHASKQLVKKSWLSGMKCELSIFKTKVELVMKMWRWIRIRPFKTFSWLFKNHDWKARRNSNRTTIARDDYKISDADYWRKHLAQKMSYIWMNFSQMLKIWIK